MPDIIPSTKNILIVAGDPSGDLHGANLIKELKKLDPEISVAALGGSRMQEAADKFIYNLVGLGAAGFAEPLKRFWLWIRLISLVRRYMEEKRPACFIAIDFYGLNHQLLGVAKHRKIPAFYYVSPQVWASRPTRAQALARLAQKMLVIFPFEVDVYKKAGATVEFVGHPLLDLIPEPSGSPAPRGQGYAWKIGLLPGSRPYELRHHLPLFCEAFAQIKEVFPEAEAHVFAVPEFSDDFYMALVKEAEQRTGSAIPVKIVRETDYRIRAQMDAAITCSGTATLENALLGLPMVVAYQAPWITYQIAKRVITVKYISLVNIIAGRPLVREYIQNAATPSALSGQVMALMQNPDKLNAMRGEFLKLRKSLGEPGAAKRAAAIISASAFPRTAP